METCIIQIPEKNKATQYNEQTNTVYEFLYLEQRIILLADLILINLPYFVFILFIPYSKVGKNEYGVSCTWQ